MRHLILCVASLALAASPALAANNYAVKDAASVTITKCAIQQSDGSQADCAAPIDSTGAQIDPATKQIQSQILAAITALGTGRSYTQSVVTLTANQAAGTDPILPANSGRRGLVFGAAVNFQIALSAGATSGQRIFATARDALEAPVPTGALYLVAGSGLVAGNTIVIWEA